MTDDWIFYRSFTGSWGDHSRPLGNLHRIGFDGTQNILLSDELIVSSILVVNNALLATVYAGREDDVDAPWHEAVVLSEDGDVVKTLGGGWHGHNSFIDIQQLANTNMVMIIRDGAVRGLYCTATGAIFSL